MRRTLITGATGTIGGRVDALLTAEGHKAVRAVRSPRQERDVRFDFTDPATWQGAFEGVDAMLVVRPPALGNVRRDMIPALDRAVAMGLRHVVVLSVQGAQSLPFLPHAALEKWARESAASSVSLRPAYFHQNLTTTLAPDIRHGRVMVPAAKSRMAWVDGEDVAEVAVQALIGDHDGHSAMTLTGDETPTWHEVAELLTQGLGRSVEYRPIGLARWVRHATNELGMPLPAAVVAGLIHASPRLGRSATTTSTVAEVTGHRPRDLESFIARQGNAWQD